MRAVVTALLLCGAALCAHAVQSQDPEIVPSGGTFPSEVKARIIASERKENVLLFYTVSPCCCTCACYNPPSATKSENGIDKVSRELDSLSKPILVTAEVTCIAALAVTLGSEPSGIVKQEYRIQGASGGFGAPVIHPKRGKYSGFVKVNITKADGSAPASGEKFLYTIDGTEPTVDKGLEYKGGFEIHSLGVHSVKAILVSTDSAGKNTASMHCYRDLEVVLAAAYELAPAEPEQGKSMTIMFQGFKPTMKTKVFVSTADCSKKHMKLTHELRGCNCAQGRIPVSPSLLSLTFLPLESSDTVYVCLSRNNGETWTKLKRASTKRSTFSIGAGGRGAVESEEQNELVEEDVTPPMSEAELRKHAETPNKGEKGWSIEPFVVVVVILGTGMIFIFKKG